MVNPFIDMGKLKGWVSRWIWEESRILFGVNFVRNIRELNVGVHGRTLGYRHKLESQWCKDIKIMGMVRI